jgi:hypothetical protein
LSAISEKTVVCTDALPVKELQHLLLVFRRDASSFVWVTEPASK